MKGNDLVDFDNDDMDIRDEESDEASIKEDTTRFKHLEKKKTNILEVKKLELGNSPLPARLNESRTERDESVRTS